MIINSSNHNIIIGSSFDPKAASSYYICIQIGKQHIKSAVLDLYNKKFVAIEDFEFDREEKLEELLNYWKKNTKFEFFSHCNIVLSRYSNPFTLIPKALFTPELSSKYLELNGRVQPNSTFSNRLLPDLEAHLVYAIDSQQEEKLKTLLPNVQLIHPHAGLLEGLSIDAKNQQGNLIHLDVSDTIFSFAVFRNNKLEFFNDFKISSTEDALYYSIFSLEQLGIRPNKEMIRVTGDIKFYDDFIDKFALYINEVDLSTPPVSFQFDEKLKKKDLSVFYNLFCEYLCV